MITRFLKWWNTPRPFRAWAVRHNSTFSHDAWCKVVSNSRGRPVPLCFNCVGPFRSEVECDEFCDHANHGMAGKIKLYCEAKL